MLAGLVLLLVSQTPEFAPVDHKVLPKLTAVHEEGPLVFHYDAATLDAQTLKADVKRNLGFHRYLEKAMRMKYRGRIRIFLYKDMLEMQALTGSKAAAFSTGTRSIHQAHDYDDAHEMVHIFALQIPKGDDHVDPDPLFVEGLATTLQREDNGIAIDDYTAIAYRIGRIPRLVPLRRTFPKGAPSGVHSYHVAGTFMGFLIDRYGIEKVKSLYVNCLECEGRLGKSFATLEREWWPWLGKLEVRADTEKTLLQRFGFGEGHRLPANLQKAKRVALFDGRSLNGWNLEHPQSWRAQKKLIVGATDGAWHRMHSQEEFQDTAVRVRLRLVSGNAVQIRLNRTATTANEAILATWMAYLVRVGPGGGVKKQAPYHILPGSWLDIVFENKGGHGTVWIDGLKMLEADGLGTENGSVGISVERGVVEVASIERLVVK